MKAEKDVMKVRSALRRSLDSIVKDRMELNARLMKLNTKEADIQEALSMSDDELMKSYAVEVYTIDVATEIKRTSETEGVG